MATTERSREEHAIGAEENEDKRIMLFSIPKGKFINLCVQFPVCQSFIFTRAMLRRSMFRNIELLLNNRYTVDLNYDFIRETAKFKKH